MEDAREVLRALIGIDRRAAVAGACTCARSVLSLVTTDDPQRALDRVDAWLTGAADAAACLQASEAAHQAAASGYASGGRAAANAAHAAGYAAGAVGEPADALRAADAAGMAIGNTAGRRWREASAAHLASLMQTVRAVGWSAHAPALAEVVAAPAEVQVAWDWLSRQPSRAMTLGGVLDAHALALRLGLRWDDAVQRAVAERAGDEAELLRILSRGGGSGS